MKYEQLLEPKAIEIGENVFAISKIPALKARAVYNVISELMASKGLIGVTQLPEGTIKDILAYVNYKGADGSWQEFLTDTRINECFKEYGDLVSVVIAMVKENFSFLADGGLLEKLEEATRRADSGS